MKKSILIAFIALVVAPFSASSQDFELGLLLGASQYQGDLGATTKEDIQKARINGNRFSFGILARKYFNPNWAFRGGLQIGWVAANDNDNGENTDRERRNLSFSSYIGEINLGIEWNIFKYIPGSENHRFTPYLFAGVGGFLFNPQGEYNGTKYNLQEVVSVVETKGGPQTTNDYSRFQICLPMGVGLKYNISKMWTLGFEVGWRKTFTDYLDNVSGELTGDAQGLLAAGKRPEAFFTDRWGTDPFMEPDDPNKKFRPEARRGNPDQLDSYYMAVFSLSKTFRKYACVNRNVIDLD